MSNNDNNNELDFEASMKRLDAISSALEKDSVSLEEALKLYEEGVRLVRACNERLENAERKIKLLKIGADGEVSETDMPPLETVL